MSFMSFLMIFVSTFLYDYFFTWIISLLPIRKKKLINVIVISICNLSEIIYYAVSLIYAIRAYQLNQIDASISQILLYYLSNIIAVALAYTAMMVIQLNGVRIFKSKRQRAFERSYNGIESNGIPKKVISVLAIIFGVLCIGFAVWLFIEPSSVTSYINAAVMSLLGISLAILAVYLLKPKKATEAKMTNEDVLVDICYLDNNFRFKGHIANKDELDQMLGQLSRAYNLNDYGYIIKGKEKLHVFGIKTEQFDLNILDTIKLSYIKGFEYDEAVACFVKFKRKNVYIDENNHFVKEVEIK